MNNNITITLTILATTLTLLGCTVGCTEDNAPAPSTGEVSAFAPSGPQGPLGQVELELPPAAGPQAPAPAPTAMPAIEVEAGPSLGPAQISPSGGLSLERLLLTEAIEHREPVSPSRTLSADAERTYAFMHFRNTDEEPRDVLVRFQHESGYRTGEVDVTIPANAYRHRTWAYSRYVNKPGTWTVEVIDEDGQAMAEMAFVIE